MRRNSDEVSGGASGAGSMTRAALALALAASCAMPLAGCAASEPEPEVVDESEVVIVEDAGAGESGDASCEEAVEDVSAEVEAKAAPLEVSDLDLDAVPSADGQVTTFSLAGGETPTLDPEDFVFIQECLGDVERYGDVSLVLVDCDTGAGIAYNTDAFVYGASSFKGPYCAYLCNELVDGGLVSLDGLCAIPDDLELETTAWQHGRSYYVRDLVEATILLSDNDAYKTLHRSYDTLGYSAWVAEFGDGAVESTYDYYHVTSARTMAKAWAYAWDYLCSDSETASWLGSLLADTNVSPLRDVLEGAGATIYDKAGWFAGSAEYNSTSDAGIVQMGERTYLVAVLTSCSYGGSGLAAVNNLIYALFAAAGVLA